MALACAKVILNPNPAPVYLATLSEELKKSKMENFHECEICHKEFPKEGLLK